MAEHPQRAGSTHRDGSDVVARWVGAHAHPLTALDPSAPLDDLQPLAGIVGDATVVGIGVAARSAHELAVVAHRMIRFLVEHMGFRSVAFEEGWTTGVELDEYVRGADADPRELLAEAWPPWRTEETVELLRWARSYNERHADDPVRIVGVDVAAVGEIAYDAVIDYVRRVAPDEVPAMEALYAPLRPRCEMGEHTEWYCGVEKKRPLVDQARQAYGFVHRLPAGVGRELVLQHARAIVGFYEYHAIDRLEYAERRLAGNTTHWHEITGHKIVYVGGLAHVVDGNPRTVSAPPAPLAVDRNAGSHLRERFGDGYVPIGVTFDHGRLPFEVPPARADFAESPFGRLESGPFLLDLSASPQPDPVAAWLSGPATVRVIGPHYDAADDGAYHLTGGSLAEWVAAIAHVGEVTPTRPVATG